MSRICIIPARGGSKRIKGKNVKLFHGVPIISYPIMAARDCQLFDAIYVSTEDRVIAEVVAAWSDVIAIIHRPEHLANDYVGTQPVMRHALQSIGAASDDVVCCLYATGAMVTPEDLRLGYTTLTKTTWNPAYSLAITTYDFPVAQALRRAEDGAISPTWGEAAEARSQDLEERWHDAGQWYWGRASAFMRDERIYSPASIGVPIPRWRVQDINTEEDWIRAELMYAALIAKPAAPRP